MLQTERADRLEEEVESLRKRLEDRTITEMEAGSIAEAALRLNGIFEAADIAMAAIALSEGDFVAIIELPEFGTVLPVCGVWNADGVVKYPHRFTGSMYDGSLVVGGSDNRGQFDFIKTVTVGNTVLVTDTVGTRYTYSVAEVEKTKDVSSENLCAPNFDLTLFSRNTYGFEYTVVRCVIKK